MSRYRMKTFIHFSCRHYINCEAHFPSCQCHTTTTTTQLQCFALGFTSCGSLLRCRWWVKAKSSQVPDMFPKEFPSSRHVPPKSSQVPDMFPKEFPSSRHVPQRVPKFLTCSPKSSQVPDMFPKEFPIAPHFYPICFGKCCPPFTYIGGQRGGTLCFKVEPFYFGEPP